MIRRGHEYVALKPLAASMTDAATVNKQRLFHAMFPKRDRREPDGYLPPSHWHPPYATGSCRAPT